jgi:centrosomal protein CEP76
MVKLFAETEDGSYKPVTSLIQPVRCNRMIDSPLHAARFISLIPFEREEAPGGLRNEIWHSMFTFATLAKGDAEDHAVLLCNLLIGYGMDAFVCLGTSGDGSHAWVLTRGADLVFWESITGQRMPVNDPRVHRFYRTIGCVFNGRSFYGNIQADDLVVNTNWDLENPSYWKACAPEMLSQVVPVSRYLTLNPPRADSAANEIALEKVLKEVITQHRNR